MKLASQTGVRKVDFSIIVVSYNSRRVLGNCLSSIIRSCSSSAFSHEVIVVDNNSTDGSADFVAEAFPQVRVVRRTINAGYASGVNAGIAESEGKFLCILNSDTEVESGALDEMIRFLGSHPSVGVAGPQLLNPDGSPQDSCFRFPTLAMTFLDFFPINHRLARSWLNGRYPSGVSAQPFPVDHPLGACMVVRRESIDAVGGMDESYFMYCEEVDWCLRMKKGGWEVFCVPEAKVIHVGGESTGQNRGEMFYALHRARFKFFARHYSHFFALAAAAITRIGVLRELVRLGLAWQRMADSQEQAELRTAYKKVLAMPVGAPNE